MTKTPEGIEIIEGHSPAGVDDSRLKRNGGLVAEAVAPG